MITGLFGRPPAARHPEVVVVTRAGCHLCEEMLAGVRAHVGTGPGAGPRTLDLDAALAAGDVTPAQHARWTTLVPVLLVDGQEVAHHRVAPEQLARLLRPRRPADRRRGPRRFGGSGGANIE